MLDIKFIKENQDKVKKAILDKGINLNLEELMDVDAKRRNLLTEFESLSAVKNQVSKEIPKLDEKEKKTKLLEMKEVDQKMDGIKEKLKEILEKFKTLSAKVPNIPSEETPIGKDESTNVPFTYWSETLGHISSKDKDKVAEIPTKFDFEPKDHIALAKNLNLVDMEKGTKTSGFRGYYLKNEAVLMQYGLLWLALKKMREKGFDLMIPPILVKDFALFGSGHFPFGREEVYQIGNPGRLSKDSKKENLFLAGTSESSLLAFYAGTTLEENDLPVKVCGISPCFRSEVGSYGKDTKGLYRVHEFFKVEQVVLCKADIAESDKWLEQMRETAQEMLIDLKLPHRVINVSTGDMGAGKYKMYDIETWMPGRASYGETHSDSNLTDWQARRLNIKYKDKEGKSKHVYTLNNTVIASPRILIAILENYQQKDGSVVVPEILKPYVGKDFISSNPQQSEPNSNT